MTARDILDELDYDASDRRSAFFPDFGHGYNYHVDARLSVYGDATRWAVLIEQLAVNPRSGGLAGTHTDLYFHGHCIVLPPQEGWGKWAVKTVNTLENGSDVRLLDGESLQTVNKEATHVRLRGQVVPIRMDENYYWARAIDVKRGLPRVGRFELSTWHLMRGLVPEYRELLLSNEKERREGLPDDLPLLLQLDDWDHPRLMGGELPSSCESFQLIARVLAAGNAKLYQPTEPGNVHWRNWPESGSL